jgi:hypothetical protein
MKSIEITRTQGDLPLNFALLFGPEGDLGFNLELSAYFSTIVV